MLVLCSLPVRAGRACPLRLLAVRAPSAPMNASRARPSCALPLLALLRAPDASSPCVLSGFVDEGGIAHVYFIVPL